MRKSREQITAENISRIIPDLHLVDLEYYIDNIQHNRKANIADIVNSATELYFVPHALHFADRCYYHNNKGQSPTVILQMVFSHRGVYIDFYLILSKLTFGIKILNMRFFAEDDGFDKNTQKLEYALQDALLIKPKRKLS